jgi:hypothetical protein
LDNKAAGEHSQINPKEEAWENVKKLRNENDLDRIISEKTCYNSSMKILKLNGFYPTVPHAASGCASTDAAKLYFTHLYDFNCIFSAYQEGKM